MTRRAWILLLAAAPVWAKNRTTQSAQAAQAAKAAKRIRKESEKRAKRLRKQTRLKVRRDSGKAADERVRTGPVKAAEPVTGPVVATKKGGKAKPEIKAKQR